MAKEQFLIKLKQGITSVFNKIEDKQDLFQFGIFTDSDVSSMILFYNTYTHFAQYLENFFLDTHIIASSIRWGIPEWFKQIDEDDALFDEANKLLYNEIQPVEAEVNPENFQDVLLDLITTALVELREEGVFSSMNKDAILFVQQGDSYINASARRGIRELIGEELYKDFLYDYRDDPGFDKLISFKV